MTTLSEIKASGMGLMANCAGPNCGHGKPLDMDMLIERFGTDYEMVGERRISASLKCDRCGRKGAVIHSLANTMPNGYAKAKDDRSDC
ncbi:hypothetical protein DBIPINDM_008433 (plasmid) [Mesorhizobium sp. AR02]|nr:hypothetical protein [Mesorhizobium sp. AR02]UVK57465.1 hypothetical protein DBIPINDM_008433 [Mesorhizobium sp. AR02]